MVHVRSLVARPDRESRAQTSRLGSTKPMHGASPRGRQRLDPSSTPGSRSKPLAVETRLAAERRAWVAGEGERIAAALAAGLSEIEVRIANQVARVLKPVIAGHVQRRAVEELVQTLEALLTKGDVGRITVSGPEDLLGALRGSLEGKASNVTFAPAATADLRIEADETVLETRIAAWAAAIGGEAS